MSFLASGASSVGRHFALVGSVALHLTVGVVAGGHAIAEGKTRDADGTVVVEIDTLAPPASRSDERDPGDRREADGHATAQAHPTHKHDYPVPAGHDAWPHDPSIVHVAALAETSDVREESPMAQAAVDAPVRFVLAPSVRVGSREGASSGHEASDGDARSLEAVPESGVSRAARISATVPVSYPPEARAAEIEADVALEIIVDRSGSVVDARPVSHEGYGLEAAAVRAVRDYRFTPAQRNGQTVRVRMRWTVQFRLR